MTQLFDLSLLAAGLRTATPILLAALGGLFTEQAGVLNIALEGIMLSGAFTAVAVNYFSGSWLLGVLAAVLMGLLTAWILAVFILKLNATEVIVGMGINLFASGLTAFLLRTMWTDKSELAQGLVALPRLNIPGLAKIPILGPLFSGHSLLVYVALAMVFVTHFVIYRTRLGLRIRAVGKNAEATASVGIDTLKLRYIAACLSGALCGLAGAHLSLGMLTMFTDNMTAGRGFMALAVIYFGDAKPYMVALGAILFGCAEALSMRLQSLGLPSHFIIMIPYVFTVIALIAMSINKKKVRPAKPAAEGAK